MVIDCGCSIGGTCPSSWCKPFGRPQNLPKKISCKRWEFIRDSFGIHWKFITVCFDEFSE